MHKFGVNTVEKRLQI